MYEYATVQTTAQEPFPVLIEMHVRNVSLVDRDLLQLLVSSGVPHHDTLVHAPTDDFPVLTDVQTKHCILMPVHFLDLLLLLDRPDNDGLVLSSADDDFATRRYADGIDLTYVAIEVAQCVLAILLALQNLHFFALFEINMN